MAGTMFAASKTVLSAMSSYAQQASRVLTSMASAANRVIYDAYSGIVSDTRLDLRSYATPEDNLPRYDSDAYARLAPDALFYRRLLEILAVVEALVIVAYLMVVLPRLSPRQYYESEERMYFQVTPSASFAPAYRSTVVHVLSLSNAALLLLPFSRFLLLSPFDHGSSIDDGLLAKFTLVSARFVFPIIVAVQQVVQSVYLFWVHLVTCRAAFSANHIPHASHWLDYAWCEDSYARAMNAPSSCHFDTALSGDGAFLNATGRCATPSMFPMFAAAQNVSLQAFMEIIPTELALQPASLDLFMYAVMVSSLLIAAVFVPLGMHLASGYITRRVLLYRSRLS
jgi:hypothetical protein